MQEELFGLSGTEARVQVALGVKLPEAAPFENVTVPLGFDCEPESVSVTTAVQLEPWLIATEPGEQETEVKVVRLLTVRAKPVASELLAWVLPLAV